MGVAANFCRTLRSPEEARASLTAARILPRAIERLVVDNFCVVVTVALNPKVDRLNFGCDAGPAVGSSRPSKTVKPLRAAESGGVRRRCVALLPEAKVTAYQIESSAVPTKNCSYYLSNHHLEGMSE